MVHALFGAHLPHCPIVRTAGDRVEPDKAHPLVIEGPVGLVEELLPLRAHVVVPVVLARDEDLPNFHFVQDLDPELKLVGSAELGEVAAEDHEVGRRVHGLDFPRGTLHLFDEARVD